MHAGRREVSTHRSQILVPRSVQLDLDSEARSPHTRAHCGQRSALHECSELHARSPLIASYPPVQSDPSTTPVTVSTPRHVPSLLTTNITQTSPDSELINRATVHQPSSEKVSLEKSSLLTLSRQRFFFAYCVSKGPGSRSARPFHRRGSSHHCQWTVSPNPGRGLAPPPPPSAIPQSVRKRRWWFARFRHRRLEVDFPTAT